MTPETDASPLRADRREAENRPGARWPSFRQAPLIPEAGAAGGSLTAVLAVIAALAALALAAALLIADATRNWTEQLASAMTVQVKGADVAEIDAGVAAALGVLEATDGVLSTRVVPSAEAARLLEPWLGKGNTQFLNVPALIEVSADPALRERLDVLRADLAAAAPGAALDDHGEWHGRLTAAAGSGQALAFGVFGLILVAACAIAAFAARAGLAANAEIVSLLHIIGATDEFVADQVQRRFFMIGLRGSLAGLAVAIFAMALVALGARAHGRQGFLLPGLSLDPWLLGALVVVPITICLATAVTARITILRTLRGQY